MGDPTGDRSVTGIGVRDDRQPVAAVVLDDHESYLLPRFLYASSSALGTLYVSDRQNDVRVYFRAAPLAGTQDVDLGPRQAWPQRPTLVDDVIALPVRGSHVG